MAEAANEQRPEKDNPPRILRWMPGLKTFSGYRKKDLGPDVLAGLVVYRFYGPLIFANVNYFIERLQGFISDPEHPVRRVVIDARAIPSVDFTAREKLRPFFQKLRNSETQKLRNSETQKLRNSETQKLRNSETQKLRDQGLELAIARAHLPLREVNVDRGMEPVFSDAEIFGRVTDAVRDFREAHDEPLR